MAKIYKEDGSWYVRGYKGFKRISDEVAAYAEFYLFEQHEIQNPRCRGSKYLDEFPVLKLVNFYYGQRCFLYQHSKITKATFDNYRSAFNRSDLFSGIMKKPVSEVSMSDVIDMNLPFSIHRFIGQAFKLAYELGIIGRNPLLLLKEKPVRGVVVCPDAITVGRLMAYSRVDESRLYLALFLTAKCGLRISEVMGLKWSDISLTSISVERQKHKGGDITKCKRNSSRVIRVDSDYFADALEVFDADYKSKLGDGGFLFKIGHQRLRSLLVIACDAVGVHRFNFHSMRHHAASLMIENRSNREVDIARALGHADYATTANVYAHVISERSEVVCGI